MTIKKWLPLLLSAVILLNLASLSSVQAVRPVGTDPDELRREIDCYNYYFGTNAFEPGYQFTQDDPLMEVADQIAAWGSNMVKFNAGNDMDLVDQVLEGRDFDYVFLWFRSHAYFKDGYSEAEARADYDAFYAFTQKLLQTYNGTGKQFFLGHWEGDWYYLDDKSQEKVDDAVTEGMIEWMNNRQKAVDDAKRDTPHRDVSVWNYLELNRPADALNKGYDRVVNRVLPHTNVDYVSYSAYDTKKESTRTIRRTIDYIQENLPEKSGVPGPRVFIGEAAEPASQFDYNDKRHCDANLRIMVKHLRCDELFFLYWEMYCNEKLPDGRQNGFWLIDSDGNKTLLYHKLQRVFLDGKEYVEDFARENGRVPTHTEYRQFLLRHPVFVKARIGVFFTDLVDPFRLLVNRISDLIQQ